MPPPLNIHGDKEVEKEEMEKDEEKESERDDDEDTDEESDDEDTDEESDDEEEEEEEEMIMLLIMAASAVVIAVVNAVLAIMTVEHACKHNVDELAKLRHSIGDISQSLEAMRGRMERNCRHCWDVVKEMDMDDATRFQVMELLKAKTTRETRDMFLGMTVQERKGWIEYKLSSNRSSC